MKKRLFIPLAFVMILLLACEPKISTTCEKCEFFEYEYNESLFIISGFDTTKVLIEQPYPDWESMESQEPPEIVYSDIQANDSTLVLRLTVEAGAGSDDGRAMSEIGFDGEKFRVWYGSASRQFYKSKAIAVPRPPYFRIRKIEVRTPYQKEAEVEFKIRYGR